MAVLTDEEVWIRLKTSPLHLFKKEISEEVKKINKTSEASEIKESCQ